MVVGEGQGMSQPAHKRYGDTKLEWSDATIDLGWYISVLATEYGLRKKKGENTDSTLRELYYALQCFNRLDDYAESYFHDMLNCGSKPLPGSGFTARNGFFIRDDVTDDFVIRNKHHFKLTTIDLKDPADPGFEKGVCEGYGPREMSFDQVVHLMMGFALVTRLVDTSAVYNGINITYEAKDIVRRMMDQTRSAIWHIRNPVTGKSVMGGSLYHQALWDSYYKSRPGRSPC